MELNYLAFANLENAGSKAVNMINGVEKGDIGMYSEANGILKRHIDGPSTSTTTSQCVPERAQRWSIVLVLDDDPFVPTLFRIPWMCPALDPHLGFPTKSVWASTDDKQVGVDGLRPLPVWGNRSRDLPHPIASEVVQKSAQRLFSVDTLSLAPLRGLCFNFFPSLETGEAGPFAVRISRGKVGVIPLFFVPSARLPVTP